MILSDKDLRERIIQDHKEAQQAREWWEKGQWDKIGSKILIDPFKTQAVGVCSYDLSVGEEYRSLRDPRNTKKLEEGESICIGPGETVLILTEQYICLPKNVVSIIVPRARWIFEGTSICATRVDPTWYGKLLVGFTNLAKNPVELYRQKQFCTCYFMETSETDIALTKDKVPFLGRTKIGEIEFSHALEQKLRPTDKITQDDIEKVVDLYGWPWDVVRGMFELTKKDIGNWIEKEVTSDIVSLATTAAVKTAFDQLINQYNEQTKWTRTLTIGVLTIAGTVGAAIVAAIIVYLLNLT